MKYLNWRVVLGLSLVAVSTLFYFLHYAIFRDSHHIFIYLIGDIAFVPVEVLLVTLIIHSLLSSREKRIMLEKLNMIIGSFFSAVGTQLLEFFSDFDPKLDEIRNNLIITTDLSERQYDEISRRLKSYDYTVDINAPHLEELRRFLAGKNDFLLRLLENPNLLEHESFTELLRAVFHLTEELIGREDLRDLPGTDKEHLRGDVSRAYVLLVSEWLDYMRHLRNNYPYLFSLAMRKNPFDQNASLVIR